MKIIDFYLGKTPNHKGDRFDHILDWSDDWLEYDHEYIQWLFPNEIPSEIVAEAPVLTKEEARLFQENPELQEKVERALFRFLDFLGMDKRFDKTGKLIIEPLPKADWWSKRFNHTMLRITRILKSLRLVGLSDHSLAFYNGLMMFKDRFSPDTLQYWENATFSDLPYIKESQTEGKNN